MAYIAARELRAVVPDQYRDAALADQGGQPDPGLLAAVIEAACTEVDALIEGRVRLPLSTPIPSKIKTAALYVALEILFVRRGVDMPEAMARKVAWWRDWLSKVGAGELRIDAPAEPSEPTSTAGGSIVSRPSVMGTGGLLGSLLLLASLAIRAEAAIPPRDFAFTAGGTNLIESPDFLEWIQGESVRLRYTLLSPNTVSTNQDLRWEISDPTNLWVNAAPTTSGQVCTWTLPPTNTALPAGRYQGRVSAYERSGTNLTFHRVVAWQDIRVHAARDPQLLILASPLSALLGSVFPYVRLAGGDIIEYNPSGSTNDESYALQIFANSQHDEPKLGNGLRIAKFPHTNTTHESLLRVESGSSLSNLETRFVITAEGRIGINVGRPEDNVGFQVNADTYFCENILWGEHSRFMPYGNHGPAVLFDGDVQQENGVSTIWNSSPEWLWGEEWTNAPVFTLSSGVIDQGGLYEPMPLPRYRILADGRVVIGTNYLDGETPNLVVSDTTISRGDKVIDFETGTQTGFDFGSGDDGAGRLDENNELLNNNDEVVARMDGSWAGDGSFTIGDVQGGQGGWYTRYSGVDGEMSHGQRGYFGTNQFVQSDYYGGFRYQYHQYGVGVHTLTFSNGVLGVPSILLAGNSAPITKVPEAPDDIGALPDTTTAEDIGALPDTGAIVQNEDGSVEMPVSLSIGEGEVLLRGSSEGAVVFSSDIMVGGQFYSNEMSFVSGWDWPGSVIELPVAISAHTNLWMYLDNVYVRDNSGASYDNWKVVVQGENGFATNMWDGTLGPNSMPLGVSTQSFAAPENITNIQFRADDGYYGRIVAISNAIITQGEMGQPGWTQVWADIDLPVANYGLSFVPAYTNDPEFNYQMFAPYKGGVTNDGREYHVEVSVESTSVVDWSGYNAPNLTVSFGSYGWCGYVQFDPVVGVTNFNITIPTNCADYSGLYLARFVEGGLATGENRLDYIRVADSNDLLLAEYTADDFVLIEPYPVGITTNPIHSYVSTNPPLPGNVTTPMLTITGDSPDMVLASGVASNMGRIYNGNSVSGDGQLWQWFAEDSEYRLTGFDGESRYVLGVDMGILENNNINHDQIDALGWDSSGHYGWGVGWHEIRSGTVYVATFDADTGKATSTPIDEIGSSEDWSSHPATTSVDFASQPQTNTRSIFPDSDGKLYLRTSDIRVGVETNGLGVQSCTIGLEGTSGGFTGIKIKEMDDYGVGVDFYWGGQVLLQVGAAPYDGNPYILAATNAEFQKSVTIGGVARTNWPQTNGFVLTSTLTNLLSGYLPLTAGSGKPLSGPLYVDTVASPAGNFGLGANCYQFAGNNTNTFAIGDLAFQASAANMETIGLGFGAANNAKYLFACTALGGDTFAYSSNVTFSTAIGYGAGAWASNLNYQVFIDANPSAMSPSSPTNNMIWGNNGSLTLGRAGSSASGKTNRLRGTWIPADGWEVGSHDGFVSTTRTSPMGPLVWKFDEINGVESISFYDETTNLIMSVLLADGIIEVPNGLYIDGGLTVGGDFHHESDVYLNAPRIQLSTSTNGLSSGMLWNSNGVPAIVP